MDTDTHPSLDLVPLTDALHRIAWRVGRRVPSHVMDHCDFMQVGWIGVLLCARRPDEPADEYRNRQLLAAERDMIDALRSLHDPRYPGGRKRELLVPDIVALSDWRQAQSRADERLIHALDLDAHVARLSPRNQFILRGRLHGDTLLSLATQLHLTEGHLCQLEKTILVLLHGGSDA